MRFLIYAKLAGGETVQLSNERFQDELLGETLRAIIAVKHSEVALIVNDIEAILEHVCTGGFAFLVPRKPAPKFGARRDAFVESFAVSADLLQKVALERDGALHSCGRIFLKLLEDNADMRVDVLQIPRGVSSYYPAIYTREALSWVIAHRGAPRFLNECLRQIRKGDTRSRILLGIDERRSDELVGALSAIVNLDASFASPPGFGPYLIRNALVASSKTPLVCFQDSDDIPCFSRSQVLSNAILEEGVGMVGSHELRIDNTTGEAYAFRYPLNVNAALEKVVAQPLLHPSSMVRTDQFLAAGGFSTTAKFAMDTQFLLRSYFSIKSRNVDEFLYIRRNHPHALTRHKGTGMKSLARVRIVAPWKKSFEAVRKKHIRLVDSELTRRGRCPPGYNLIPLVRK